MSRERFVRNELFELIFGRAGARDVPRARLRRDVIDPVPAQCVIVDLKFQSSSLDRRADREEPLDPHAFEVITTLTAPLRRRQYTPPSRAASRPESRHASVA